MSRLRVFGRIISRKALGLLTPLFFVLSSIVRISQAFIIRNTRLKSTYYSAGSGHTYGASTFIDSPAVLGDVHCHIHLHQSQYHFSDCMRIISNSELMQITQDHVPFTRSLLQSHSMFLGTPGEAYTVENAMPFLYSWYGRELSMYKTHRLDQFTVLFSARPKQRLRFTITIRTKKESFFWHNKKIGHFLATTRISLKNLPSNLTAHIEAYLRSIIRLKQDSHHEIVLHGGYTFHAQEVSSKESTNLTKLSMNFLPNLHRLTSEPVYYGCPWYPEGELDLRPRYNYKQSNHFLAFLRPRWVLMIRFSPMQPHLDPQLYLMKAMRTLSLTGKAGIAKFLGIVRDDSDTITGFLIELPVKGGLRNVMQAASAAGTPISKERREKWCRQIVRIVAEVHHHGFVIGALHHDRDCGIAIDGKDDAVLHDRLGKTFEMPQRPGGAIPPELGWCAAEPVKSAVVEPQTDIYQLGLLLWRIMGDKVHGNVHEFCRLADCTTPKHAQCNEPHTNPVELLMQEDYCPKYLRDVIVACRTPQPKERPSARKLSCMLPIVDDAGYTQPPPVTMYMERPEEYQNVFSSPQVDCDVCDRNANRHHFHCGIRSNGDWDICSSCFTEGAYCFDIEHVLEERMTLYCPGRLFAHDRVSGGRKIVVSKS